MANPTVDQIQQALSDTLSRIPGVVAYPYMPRLFNYTQALILVADYSTSRDSFAPQYTYLFDLQVHCLSSPPDYGQIMLARLMSPSGTESIERVLLQDPTLGGVVDDVAIEPFLFTAAHAAMTWLQLNNGSGSASSGIEFVRLIRPIEIYA